MHVNDLRFAYGDHEVLKGISFDTNYGEFISVLGPNGVGKSTLFRCLLGLSTPTGGEVTVDGEKIAHLSPAQLARKMAYIPQSHHPLFNFSVLDMVLMGTTSQLGRFAAPGKTQEAAEEGTLADAVGAKDGDELAVLRIEGDALEHLVVAVGEPQIINMHTHRRSPSLVIR